MWVIGSRRFYETVVQEGLDIGEVLEADGDALGAGGRGVVHTSRSQGIGP
jgi:hypothetical protein